MKVLGLAGYFLMIAETLGYYVALQWLSELRVLDYGRGKFADFTSCMIDNTEQAIIILMIISIIVIMMTYKKFISIDSIAQSSLVAIFIKGITCIFTIPVVCYEMFADGANTLDAFILFFIVHIIVGWIIHILTTLVAIIKRL